MASFKNSFTELGELNTKQLEDDFVAKTLFTNKIKAKTGKNGNFTYKHKTVLKNDKLSDSREVKFDFPLTSKYFFWYGVRDNGDIKAHIDFGNITLANKDINLFTNFKSNSDRTKLTFRFGGNHFGKDLNSGLRVETECCDLNKVCLTTRNIYKRGNILAGFAATLGLSDFKFCRTDGVVGFTNDKFDFYVRHLGGDGCAPCTSTTECPSGKDAHKSYLGKVVVDAVYKHSDKHTIAVQAEENFVANTHAITFGHNSQVNDKLNVRNRLTDQLNWGLALKYKVSNNLNFTASTQLDFKAQKLIDTSKTLPIPVGFQTEWSI